MDISKIKQSILAFSFSGLILSGCGFHLRGQVVVAPTLKTVALNNQSITPNAEIKNQLADSGIAILSTAPVALHILSLEFTKKTLTSSSGYEVTDYLQTATLKWTLTHTDQKPLFPPRLIVKSRRYRSDQNQANNAEFEAEYNKKALQKELIITLTNQLAGFKEAELQTLMIQSERQRKTSQQASTPHQPQS